MQLPLYNIISDLFSNKSMHLKKKKKKRKTIHAYKPAHDNTITLSIVLHVIFYCIKLYFMWHYFIFYFYTRIQFVQN